MILFFSRGLASDLLLQANKSTVDLGEPLKLGILSTQDLVSHEGESSRDLLEVYLNPINPLQSSQIGLTGWFANQDGLNSEQFDLVAWQETVGAYQASSLPSWLSIDAEGNLAGTPLNADVGTVKIAVALTDGSNSTAVDYFDLTVTNTNDAPVIDGEVITTVAEDSLYSFAPVAIDVDPTDDELTFSIINKPDWATFDTTTGILSGTPENVHVGTTTAVVISVSDGYEPNPTNLDAFDVTVTNTNDAPILISQLEDKGIDEGTLFSVNVAEVFDDVDKGETLIYGAPLANGGVLPSWLTINENSGLCLIPDKLKEISYAIDKNHDNVISDAEEKDALDVLRKAQLQKMQNVQENFNSYLDSNR